MDEKLLQQYANAVYSRPFLKALPDGLRQWSEMFEAMCKEDLKLSEEELMKMAKPSIWSVASFLYPVLTLICKMVLKRYGGAITAATTGTAVGAFIANLIK